MRDQNNSYPLKLVSRSIPQTRTNKIRVSWFVVGMAFGIGCTSALTPVARPTQLIASVSAPAAPASVAAPQPLSEATLEVPAQAAPEEAKPLVLAKMYPVDLSLKVGNGDTLTGLLTSTGVTTDEAYTIVQAIRKVYDPKKLDVGQSVSLQLDRDGVNAEQPVIKSMVLPVSLTSTLEITRKGEDFDVKKIDAPVERKLSHAGGTINSSLYETGADLGIPQNLLAEIINAYSYDVDFQRDIKTGDTMDVLFERMQTKEGITAGYGNIIYAELELGDRTMKVYRYVDKSGNADYYNAKGESVRKALLRTPINGARITSRFGMRNHPILGFTRMHRGVDFGAAIGTPIYAAGDGTVDFVGTKGGYGNYLRIKHNGTYSSAYGHVSRFAAGVAPGRKVKQGQIVAYVGMSGMATGPHLHYEILANNSQVNPANVKFKTGNVLAGKELIAFRQNISDIEAKLASTPKGGKDELAMADIKKKSAAN